MKITGIVEVGQTRTTTEPLACTDGSILPAGSTVTVTGRDTYGWTVTTEDGREAPDVAGVQLGLTISRPDGGWRGR
jgi:hypothetical protein